MTPVEATLLSATVSFLTSILAYALSRKLVPLTSTSKLWDRIYELDKLVLTHADVFERFMNEATRTTPYFYADPQMVRDAGFYKLKAFVYFHLNVFEEIFLTTQSSPLIARQFERDGWNDYIFRKMRHPLIREVFEREASILYPGAFRDFIEKHRARINRPADANAF